MRGFIFDLDGILKDADELNYSVWKSILKGLKVKFDNAVFDEIKNLSTENALDKLLAGMEYFYSEDFKKRLVLKRNRLFELETWSLVNKQINKDIMPVLVALKRHGYKIGAFSVNTNALDILKIADLEKIFDCINSRSQESNYLTEIADKMGVEPKDCYIFVSSDSKMDSVQEGGFKRISLQESDNKNCIVIKEVRDIIEISCRSV